MTLQNQKLYIIGNGFDLHHGVASSYSHFRQYLAKVDKPLLQQLETFIHCNNLWGNFEQNLAFLSRETMMEMVDIGLPKEEPEDEDFSQADFDLAVDQLADTIWSFTDRLKYRFSKWVRSLYLPKGHKKKMLKLDKSAFYINFNYTPFLETLYQIPKEQIIYIHGNKNSKSESLILGHGKKPEQSFREWHYKNRNKKRFRPVQKNRRGNYFPNYRLSYFAWFSKEEEKLRQLSATRYYAIERTLNEIEKYYEQSRKNISKALTIHENRIKQFLKTTKIIVLGHSLSDVDMPYFRFLIDNHPKPGDVHWQFSYFNEADIKKMNQLIQKLYVPREQTKLFQLEE